MSARLAFAAFAVVSLAACEPDDLSRAREQPDAAVIERDADVEDPPDAAVFPDAGHADASGFADAMVDAGEPIATEQVYVSSQHALYSFDTVSRSSTLIGMYAPFTGEAMIDIAIDLQGRLYGGSGSGGIYRIDPSTASVTEVTRVTSLPTGLTFLSDGRLILAGSRVVVIDLATGDEPEVITDRAPLTSGDIIGLPDGSLYSTVISDSGGDDLIRINPNGGSYTRIGTLSDHGVYGLAWANQTLYGFTHLGSVLVIDPSDAQVRSRRELSTPWYGATTNPVLW
jgi:hypothetical protein